MAPRIAPGSPAGRGSIVYLHGVGGLREDWARPLREAISGLTTTIVAPSYVDLLQGGRDVYAQERRVEATTAHDIARHAYVERQRRLTRLVEAVGESAPRTWPALLPHPARIARSIPLRQVLRTPVLGLDQMGRYLDDPARRAATLERVRAAIVAAPRPRVLIGHSLGSLIAWDLLADPDIVVDLLITMGSPLGLPLADDGDVHRRDTAFPYDRVGWWLNVLHLLDPVTVGQGLHDAFPQSVDVLLAPTAGAPGSGPAVSRLASAALRAATSHLDSSYLSSQTVHAAVRAAMGPTFTVGAASETADATSAVAS